MSYNITFWKTKELTDLKIPVASFYKSERADWHPQAEELNDNLVRINLFDEESYIIGTVIDGVITVSEIDIYGEGSGSVVDIIVNPAFQDSTGKLVAVRVWEGGDSIDRITVDNGVVTIEKIEL